MLTGGSLQLSLKPFRLPRSLVIALYFLLQSIEQPRDGREHRDPLVPDGPDDFRRVQSILKHNGSSQQRRHEDSQELAEDMTQGKQVQEPNGVNEPVIFEVLLYLALDGFEVGKKVCVRQNHAFRVRRGAGSEDDLHGVLAAQIACRVRIGAMLRDKLGQSFQFEYRQTRIQTLNFARAYEQPGVYLPRNTESEIARTDSIHGYDQHAAQHASPESGDPLGAVVAPDHDAVAFGDLPRFELSRELRRRLCDPAVRPPHRAVTPAVHTGDLRTARIETVQIFDHRLAPHELLKVNNSPLPINAKLGPLTIGHGFHGSTGRGRAATKMFLVILRAFAS